MEENVDIIPADEITVTIVREGKPVEMFKVLESLGGTVEKRYLKKRQQRWQQKWQQRW